MNISSQTTQGPLLLEEGKTRRLSLEEFKEIFGVEYREQVDPANTLLRSKKPLTENIVGSYSKDQLVSQLSRLLSNPSTDLALKKISDSVGYGLFALNNIPKYTVLCFFSGEIKDKLPSNRHDHGLNYYGTNLFFSTEKYRGISSFFQHFPAQLHIPDFSSLLNLLKMVGQVVSETDLRMNDELYSIEFKPGKTREDVATENVQREYVIFNGIPVILIVASRDISKGEPLGFNYGKDYWASRAEVPVLFSRQGEVFPTTYYRRTFGYIPSLGYTGDYSSLITEIKRGNSTVTIGTNQVDTQQVINALVAAQAITEEEALGFRARPMTTHNVGLFRESVIPEVLIKRYNLPDTSQSSLEKALRVAANNNQFTDLEILIPHVKNINACDLNPESRRTALHWAAIKGHQACYNLLVSRGADIYCVDAQGKMPSDYQKSSHGIKI